MFSVPVIPEEVRVLTKELLIITDNERSTIQVNTLVPVNQWPMDLGFEEGGESIASGHHVDDVQF